MSRRTYSQRMKWRQDACSWTLPGRPTARAAVRAGTGPQPDPTALIGPRCRVKAGRNGPAAKLPGLTVAVANARHGQAIAIMRGESRDRTSCVHIGTFVA